MSAGSADKPTHPQVETKDPGATLDAPGAPGLSGTDRRRSAERALGPGDRLGRYVVLEVLGAGAMGIVFAAYDPELDRRVAIKLLLRDDGEPNAAARLIREAQSLARLSHPNVVAVHDVGVHDEQVFVAMEYVEGRPLSAWLSEEARAPSEILRVFREAGRGLAAAHARDLVHRDFKPDNVMVGRDDRVRVMDFGLARAQTGELPEDGDVSPESSAVGRGADVKLTQTGSVMGTPAYMAPEQHLGLSADARSDQFSFCVALYQGLWGKRPFQGATMHALLFSVLHDEPELPLDDGRVPARARRAILRGLAKDPDDRWPSMAALLDELEPQSQRARRIGPLALVLVPLLGAAAWLVARDESPLPCTGGAAKVEAVWNAERSTELEARLQAIAPGYAPGLPGDIVAALDDYTARWSAKHRDACEATEVRREQSELALDLRMRCLDERLEDVDDLASMLNTLDTEKLVAALDLVDDLPNLSRCDDVEALRARVPPPDDPDAAARVERADRELRNATRLTTAGSYAEAIELARAQLELADELGYAPLRARAALRIGRAEDMLGHVDVALEHLESALWSALELGDEALAAELAARHAMTIVDNVGETERAETFAELAVALARRLPERTDLSALAARAMSGVAMIASDHGKGIEWAERAIEIHRTSPEHSSGLADALEWLGVVYREAARHDEAEAQLVEALALDESIYGTAHPKLCDTLYALGRVHEARGEYEKARDLHQRTLDIRLQAYGENHVETARSIVAVASYDFYERDYAAAAREFERAIAIVEGLESKDEIFLATWRLNLSRAYLWSNDLARAEDAVDEVVRVRRERLGDRSDQLAEALIQKADVLKAQGRRDEALPLLERAYEARLAALGSEHPSMFQISFRLGQEYRKVGRREESKSLMRSALRLVQDKSDVADRQMVAFALYELGVLARDAGEIVQALDHFERAVEIREQTGHRLLAQTRLELASTLALPGPTRDRARALQLAEVAADAMRREGAKEIADAEALLADLKRR